jgi:DNA-binding response OmpR family regulator
MTRPIRVLFGDDDLDLLESYADFLESRGFEVIQVATTADLFAAAMTDDPDIILSDFDYGFGRSDALPDGVAVGLALREKGVVVPFVIHSGLDRPEARQAGFPQFEKGGIIEMPDKINNMVRGTDG